MTMQRILIIEDDFDLATSIRLGINLIERPVLRQEMEFDGAAALVRVQNPPVPDLILLDMHLPNVGGQEIYQMARQVIPQCRIVIMTADVRLLKEISEKQGDWAHLPEPDGLLAKPLSLPEFREYIRKMANE